MLLGVIVITCMVSYKQSECIIIEITCGRVLTIEITHNMSKPFAAVTLYVSRLA
jgi:hypothetical protein